MVAITNGLVRILFLETMQAVSLDPDIQDHREAVGLSTHNPPAQDNLEARRRAFQSAWSACDRNNWPQTDLDTGNVACTNMDAAFPVCQDELFDIMKTLRRRRAGMQSVPNWQEPSTIILEWALKNMQPNICIALHLSNLQRVDLGTTKFNASTPTPSTPRVLPVSMIRNLYEKLSKGEDKLKRR